MHQNIHGVEPMYVASSFIDLLLHISVGGGVGDGSEGGGFVATRGLGGSEGNISATAKAYDLS